LALCQFAEIRNGIATHQYHAAEFAVAPQHSGHFGRRTVALSAQEVAGTLALGREQASRFDQFARTAAAEHVEPPPVFHIVDSPISSSMSDNPFVMEPTQPAVLAGVNVPQHEGAWLPVRPNVRTAVDPSRGLQHLAHSRVAQPNVIWFAPLLVKVMQFEAKYFSR
jgi:hypothetical protein